MKLYSFLFAENYKHLVLGSASFYYIRTNVLARCLWFTLKSLNIRLWFFTAFILLLWVINFLLHVFFRFLDEVFYQGYKKVSIKEPVFIIANPRSGTTFLHRIITLDKGRFTYMTFADTLFCSVSFVRFRLLMSKIDSSLGKPIEKILQLAEKRIFKGWEGIHNMSFGEAEEDEALFAQMMQSSGIFVLFPFFHRIKNTHFLDNETDAVRAKAMAFYESSLKRFVYATGSNKIYLAKNVNSTGRIKSLLSSFPDARIVFIVRNPLEAVPSTASMFSVMYPLHSPQIKKTEAAYREWCEFSIDFYTHFSQARRQLNQSKIISLSYNFLTENPMAAVEKIYNHFEWNFHAELKEIIKHELKVRAKYNSAHSYSLEEYGYSEAEVENRLKQVMEEFDELSKQF